jgi:hypothetical protein
MFLFIKGGELEIKSMVSMPRMVLSSFFISYLDEADPRDMRQSKVRGWTCPPSSSPTWMRRTPCNGQGERLDLSSFFISYLDEADPRDMRQSKVRGWTSPPSSSPTWMRLTPGTCASPM